MPPVLYNWQAPQPRQPRDNREHVQAAPLSTRGVKPMQGLLGLATRKPWLATLSATSSSSWWTGAEADPPPRHHAVARGALVVAVGLTRLALQQPPRPAGPDGRRVRRLHGGHHLQRAEGPPAESRARPQVEHPAW